MTDSRQFRLNNNGRLKVGCFLLFIYMTVMSILLTGAIPQLVSLYSSAGAVYEIEDFLFLWFGYHRFLSLSNFRFLFYATRFGPLIVLPLLLPCFMGENRLEAYSDRNDCMPSMRTIREKHVAEPLMKAFIRPFLIIAAALIFQLVLSVAGSLYLKGTGIFIPDFRIRDLNVIVSSCVKIPLYYSSIGILSYSIGLFLNSPAVSEVLPVVITIGTTVLTMELTNNTPMDLAFYDSGLMTPHMGVYWFSVAGYLAVAAILVWVNMRIGKKNKSYCSDRSAHLLR